MKREEKNQQMRRRIMDSALMEFSVKGYGASSVNTICGEKDISKGILYHYFDTKDDLFLACVRECFTLLTEFIRENMQAAEGSDSYQLEQYFNIRMAFFEKYPVYQRIFCEAVITPPVHLSFQIQECRKDFDRMNAQILERLLEPIELRPGITKAEAIEIFRQFQDFFHANYQRAEGAGREFENHEESCKRAADILLYGIVNRKQG
ncbi:MAG: TetR/AcrR family transcriptional regulator [Lachnospiraceae bacterium]